MEKHITSRLEVIHSNRDTNGNVYWALRFTDLITHKSVKGTVCGGEGNIKGIQRCWNPELNDWDRSIQIIDLPLKIRAFDRLTKDWDHLGCGSEDLTEAIKARLESQPALIERVIRYGN